MPSAQAIRSGVPLGVTGAYTTPNTGRLSWSNPTEIAEPLRPLRKSLVPSLQIDHPARWVSRGHMASLFTPPVAGQDFEELSTEKNFDFDVDFC